MQTTNSPGLMYCPICAKEQKKQVLGKLLQDGTFLVLRFHQGTTLIESESYRIRCGCGYQVSITQGTISAYGTYAKV